MSWLVSNNSGSTGDGSATGTGNELVSQKFNVYQPEQWDAWRQLQTGAAYSPEVLNNYLSNYIDPAIQRAANARINQARNQYNTPSGYFSASNALAQQRAMYDAGESMASQRAKASMDFLNSKNQMMAEMLNARPEETKIYRPGSAATAMSGLSFGANKYLGSVGSRSISGYQDIPFGSTGGGGGGITSISGGGGGSPAQIYDNPDPYGVWKYKGAYPTSNEVQNLFDNSNYYLTQGQAGIPNTDYGQEGYGKPVFNYTPSNWYGEGA